MGRKRFSNMNCSVAQALEVIGDWWSLLIIRDAFFGLRRFSDFEKDLGIAKNVLSDRLQHLVDHEILEQHEVGQQGQRFEYGLSEKGKDLLPILIALRQWSDRWIYGEGAEPLILLDRKHRKPIRPLQIQSQRGKALHAGDLVSVPGPGASAETRKRFLRS